ncbi:hypothetical protein ACHHYP_15054 [Achlya hypogyna]|uniref:Uncharacterized protein n=1 Tax=Achlya hypogyna TaxID=1202772 RepID=A0A1V9YBR2_ACHHY|nr:hypothetical protein ACHHYP_15054 [Achlya hypogyna]
MDGRPDNIRSLILEKEKELHDINEYRIRTLEGMLKEKEAAMAGYKQKFYKLQEDFKYNLKLLEGRDEELALYDNNFATMKIVLRDRENEIGELRIQLADMTSDIKAEKQKHIEQDAFYNQKLKDARGQVEAARWSYDDAVRKQKDDFEAYKRRTERELREKDEDLEGLRREMTVTFDELLRARELEFKAATDDLQGKLRETELKAKSIGREVDTTKERNTELRRKVDDLLQQLHESETQAKSLQWELSDVRGLKDAKIAELEADKVDLQQVKQALLDEYEGKMAELLQSLHAVEKAFLQQKAQFDDEVRRVQQRKDQEMKDHSTKFEARIEVGAAQLPALIVAQALVAKLRSVEEALEKVQTELKQAKWEAEDQVLQREREMERLGSNHKDALEQREAMLKELKNELWNSQVELKASKDASRQSVALVADAKDKETLARREAAALQQQLESLQQRLAAQDASHAAALAEKEQAWQVTADARLRDVAAIKDRLAAEKHATEERHRKAEGELLRLRGELAAQQAALLLPSVKTVSEPALSPTWSDPPPSALARESLPPASPPPSVGTDATPTKPLAALQAENTKLKSLIRTMTEELMQQTGGASPSTPVDVAQVQAEADQSRRRIAELEAQLVVVRAELTQAQAALALQTQRAAALEQELAAQPSGVDTGASLAQALQDVAVLRSERNQLMELSNQLTAELRKQQLHAPADATARIADLTQSLEESRLHNKALKKELRRWLKKDDPPSRQSSTALTEPRAAALTDDIDDADSRAPMATTLFQTKTEPPASALSDARRKLQQAKEVLALAGKKVDERPRAASVATAPKETPSQRSAMAKLKELQSKRAEMAEERKKVRNYSVPGS